MLGDFGSGARGLENLEQLLAGGVLVPIALLGDDGEQLLGGAFQVASSRECFGVIITRLQVVWVGVDLRFQLIAVACVGGFVGKLKGCANTLDFSVVLLFLRNE